MANPELTGRPSRYDERARALARRLEPTDPARLSASRKAARGLGWFSIGIGVLQLVAARPIARLVGLPGREGLVRLYGLREIANGVGLLAAGGPAAASAGLWARVGGDALDLATVAAGAVGGRRTPAAHPIAAFAAVATVTATDLVFARTLQQERHAAAQTTDYGDRSGLPSPPEAMRGAAAREPTTATAV